MQGQGPRTASSVPTLARPRCGGLDGAESLVGALVMAMSDRLCREIRVLWSVNRPEGNRPEGPDMCDFGIGGVVVVHQGPPPWLRRLAYSRVGGTVRQVISVSVLGVDPPSRQCCRRRFVTDSTASSQDAASCTTFAVSEVSPKRGNAFGSRPH